MDDLTASRRWLRAKARFACGGKLGRAKTDPVYVEVVQNREVTVGRKAYSSCGDLPHWLAEQVGVDADWINRDGPKRKWEWLPGKSNEAKLQHPGPAVRTPVSYLPEAGDILMLWNTGLDVHMCVAGDMVGGLLETFDYGAGGLSERDFPGAKCNLRKIATIGGKLYVGAKIVQKVITVPMLLAQSSALPSMTGEEIEALEKAVP